MSIPLLTGGDYGSIPSESDFEDTLTAVCEAAVTLGGVNHSGLVLFSHNYEYGEVMAEYPPRHLSVVGKQFSIAGAPLEEELVHSRRPIILPDVASGGSLGDVQKVLLEMGVRSMVVVPIIVDDEVKGSFSFDSIDEIREFKDSDVEKCTSLAKFASVVVKNAYLLKNLRALRRAMLAIASEPERDALLKAITREAANLLQVRGGGIDELDERKSELTIVAQFNMPDEIVGKTMLVGEGLAGRVIKDNLAHMTEPNYSEWEGRAPYFRNNKILQSLIGVPLHLNDKPTGVLWLNDLKPRVFSPAEIDLLKGLAAPASIALEQSELREKERDKAKRLAALADATSDIFAKLATGIRKDRLTLIARYAHEIIDAELCGIFLVEEPGWIELVAGHGYKRDGFKESLRLEITSEHPGTGLTGYIASVGDVFMKCGADLRNHTASTSKSGSADYAESGQCFSVLAIPLKTKEGELKGLISINNKNDKDGKPNQWTCFTKDDQAIGEIFAQAALVAIETANLLDEIKRGRERYKTVLEASNVLAVAKVPEDGLRGLAKLVLRCIDRSFCRILFHHESDKTLQVIAAEKADGERGNFQWEQRLGKSTNIDEWEELEQTLSAGASTVLKRNDAKNGPTLSKLSGLLQLRDIESNSVYINCMLRTPLRVDDRVVGLMTIGDLGPNADFSADEIDQARAISDQVSRLIERLEHEKTLLNSLFETEREISASTDAVKALQKITEQAYEIGRAYGRRVNVVDLNVRGGNKLKVVAAHPAGQIEHIRGIVGDPFDLNDGLGEDRRLGIVGKVIVTGVPIIESDVRSNPDYIPIHPDTLSQLVVPIKENDQTVGAISVESSENGAFDQQDRVLLEGLAVQASSAIAKERQSREHKKIRTIALAGVAARLWRHGLKDRANQIIQRAELASSLPHSDEIGEKLAGITGDAKYIRDFHFIPLSSEEGVSDEDLNLVLEEYFETFNSYMHGTGVEITVQISLSKTEDRKIRVNKEWFQQALGILVENAQVAIMSAQDKVVSVTTEILMDSRCQIQIMNTGKKIPDEIWEKMTNDQIRRANQNPDKGSGLLIAEQIMAVYAGEVEKIRNDENNIVMALVLPISR